MISVFITRRSAGIAVCAGQATEVDREGGGERTAASQVSSFYVYLGAACLPLNVVGNQTTGGRLCRLAVGNARGHSWRTSVNSATIRSRHSRTISAATNNNFFPPTHPDEGSVRHRQEDRPRDPRVLFSPSRAPCYKSDIPYSYRYPI
jgi:hypothetical protein